MNAYCCLLLPFNGVIPYVSWKKEKQNNKKRLVAMATIYQESRQYMNSCLHPVGQLFKNFIWQKRPLNDWNFKIQVITYRTHGIMNLYLSRESICWLFCFYTILMAPHGERKSNKTQVPFAFPVFISTCLFQHKKGFWIKFVRIL